MEERISLTELADAVRLRGLDVAAVRSKYGPTLLVRNAETTLTAAVACLRGEDASGWWFVWAEWGDLMVPIEATAEAADRVARVLAPART